jgi:(p)ppGpp synthase/HD superfamily hydrolase
MRQPVWQRAAAFAARGHEHQHRDDGKTPYFSHPARVATTLCVVFGCTDEDAIAAAYLHDTMENTDEGYDALKDEFGGRIADLVVALTKNMMLPKRAREKEYLDRLAKADWRARLIKLADQYDNYADTLTGEKEGTGEEARKCKEIIGLTKQDATKHPEIRRAVAALKKLTRCRKFKS